MTEERFNVLKTKLQNFNIQYSDVNGTPALIILNEEVLDACKVLKEDDSLRYNSCVDAVSVDRFEKKNRFEMIYNLLSIDNNERIFTKNIPDSKNPEMESLAFIWKSAN